jgi:uncharacterized membrane protein
MRVPQHFEGLSNWRLHCINEAGELPEGVDQMEKGEVRIDRMLVVVFDTESEAHEGKKALLQLENEGSVVVYASAVVVKNADGTATVKQSDEPEPFGTQVGAFLGSIIGLFGGPTGVAIGATVGLLAGGTADLHNALVGEDFVGDVSKELLPNKFAVVAEIQEGWTTSVDTRMEAIGGIVFRRALSVVEDTIHDEHIAAMKADIAQMKAEHAKARADRKAKIQEKINQLDSKIQARVEQAKERRQAAKERAKAKLEILKTKAAVLKARIDAAEAAGVIED